MHSLYQKSAREIVALLSSDQISIADALHSLQRRIEATEEQVNSLPTLCFERAHEHAQRLQALPAEQRGSLCGLPVSIKDLTTVEGVRTTFGCRVFENFIPDESDQLVERLEQRGGVVYAKSNTPEFGAGGITFNDVFGRTATPHDINSASGGSSGGAAASLASGCAWLSHGSDMAGSLRTPAAFCGVSSLRPSPGTIRSDSPSLPFDVLGAQGPMARDVRDLALFADMLRNDYSDTMRLAAAQPEAPLRVAVSTDLGVADIDDTIRAEFAAVLDKLSAAGWQICEAAPDLEGVHEAFDVLRGQAFAVALEQVLSNNPGVLKKELEWNINLGLDLSAERIRNALRLQGGVVNNAARFMRDYDLLLCPATSVASAPLEQRYVGFDTGVQTADYYRWLSIAYASTLMALPVITVPYDLQSSARPGGLQLIGKPWGEAALFRYARELELLLDRDPAPVDPVACAV